jgi:DNA-binding NarL/FixJ family response regulator
MVILSTGGMDVGGADVLSWIDQIRTATPQASLVILSDHREPGQIVSAFRCGARGFISTGTDPDVALRALNFILCGGSFFPPHALADLSQLADGLPDGTRDGHRLAFSSSLSGGLTLRQREVLACLRLGQSNKQIARELDMQEATVKVHIRQIMRKLGVANRTQAALHAAQLSDGRSSETASAGGLGAMPPIPAVPVMSASLNAGKSFTGS